MTYERNRGKEGRRFLFLVGDNELKAKFEGGKDLQVEYKKYGTKAEIQCLEAIGESSTDEEQNWVILSLAVSLCLGSHTYSYISV